MTWEMLSALIVIVGTLVSLGTVLAKLIRVLTRLDDTVKQLRADLDRQRVENRESHKRIIIGKNGEMLKKIGSYAREDAEALFGTKVFLDLWVKVKDNWRDRPTLVANFGYKDE